MGTCTREARYWSIRIVHFTKLNWWEQLLFASLPAL